MTEKTKTYSIEFTAQGIEVIMEVLRKTPMAWDVSNQLILDIDRQVRAHIEAEKKAEAPQPAPAKDSKKAA